MVVSWSDQLDLALWYLFVMLAHELGHHFRNQFAHKNGPCGRMSDEESAADLAAMRAFRAEIARLDSKKC